MADEDRLANLRLWGLTLAQLRNMRDFAESRGWKAIADPIEDLVYQYHKRDNPGCGFCYQKLSCGQVDHLKSVIGFVKTNGLRSGLTLE